MLLRCVVTTVMAISAEDLRRKTGFERVLSWFETEDEEIEAATAYKALEDEYLY
ncbi:hypothetical protein JCM18549_02040 [Halolamina salina]